MHAVIPKTDCGHIHSRNECAALRDMTMRQTIEKLAACCGLCDEDCENWVCLTCGDLYCSRYKNGHMRQHNEESGHPIALSLRDFSFWCYSCSDYITSPDLKSIHDTLYIAKFDCTPHNYADGPGILAGKISDLSTLIENSSCICIVTDSAINYGAIQIDDEASCSPPKNENMFSVSPPASSVGLQTIKATKTHKSIVKIAEMGGKRVVVASPNPDDLHLQAGLSPDCFIDCKSVRGGNLAPEILKEVVETLQSAPLTIVIGSRFTIHPLDQIPKIVSESGGKLAIIHTLESKFDNECDVRIWASPDKTMELLLSSLGLAPIE